MDISKKSSFEQMLENHHKRNGETVMEVCTIWRQMDNDNTEKKSAYKTMLENHHKCNVEMYRKLYKRAKSELFAD